MENSDKQAPVLKDALQKLGDQAHQKLAFYRSALKEGRFPTAVDSTVYSNNERQWGEIFLPRLLKVSPELIQFSVNSFLTERGLLFLSEKEFELDLFTCP